MYHPSQPVFKPRDIDPDREKGYEKLQKAIARSQQAPFRQIATVLGVLTTGLMVIIAGLIRLTGRGKPDNVDVSLAEMYYNVPAMALHKKIELAELAKKPISGKTLDIGCGNGIIGSTLKRMANIGSLHGVDMLPIFDQQVKEAGYVGFTISDAADMQLPDSTFDGVISICVLEHVWDLDGAMREIHRVLRSGGQLLFSTTAPEFRHALPAARFWRFFGSKNRAEQAAVERDKSSMQYHYYSDKQWHEALESLGFENIRITPIFSRSQLLLYDLINYPVVIPTVYFADKLQTLGFRLPIFKKSAVWATAVICAFVSVWPVHPGQHTHWVVEATKK